VHDAIPERKRLIGQLHLFNVKTPPRRGFCYLELNLILFFVFLFQPIASLYCRISTFKQLSGCIAGRAR
ncbi:hypothetical protein WJA85_001576, partial [Klebsiella aerogenes]